MKNIAREVLEKESGAYLFLGVRNILVDFILYRADCEGTNPSFPPKPGIPKACFLNAANFAKRDPERFRYVEGYMVSNRFHFAIHHAWVWDTKLEEVIEVTLPRNRKTDRISYLGVSFTLAEHEEISSKWGFQSLFDGRGLNVALMQSLSPDFVFSDPVDLVPHRESETPCGDQTHVE